MIGIVIIAHGNLAVSMHQAGQHILGVQGGIASVSVMPNDSIKTKTREIKAAIKQVKAKPNGKVVVLTDMFGGTPCNIAISVLKKDSVEVISGVNLPMLIKLCQCRDMELRQAVLAAKDAGRRYINIASDLLELK
ncbi:MAG: PTS sugar transporter subunit IIA [Alphaproteobacteria bacterium]|nr:PTS sugar transporter subunit IIA [Alphaproteobacteria bacterium]